MVKKILSTAAAAAIITTGASAFDFFQDKGFNYKFDGNNTTAESAITIASTKEMGDALIFPAVFAGDGWVSHLRVINTSEDAVVAKVVFYSGKDSKELRDFNIYLSGHDVWTGVLKEKDGVVKLISTDDSSPLEDTEGNMASKDKPMESKPIAIKGGGYAVVIGCIEADKSYHNQHKLLREHYDKVAKKERNLSNKTIIFNQGVIRTAGVLVPMVRVDKINEDFNKTIKINGEIVNFKSVENRLAGDVRITDTINGKDMVMPAIRLQDVTGNNQSLLYIEGEAAHLADRTLQKKPNSEKSEYNTTILKRDMAEFYTSNVWMTYGDTTSLVDNQLILTSPYKRVAIFTDINTTNGSLTDRVGASNYYKNVVYKNGAIQNFGYFSALALVYDESENQAANSQFSPATTPTLNFYYEVSATEGNPKDTDNLSYYIKQAQASGSFDRGYTLIKFLHNDGRTSSIPVIVTQMMATEAAGKVITNWIVPAQDK